MVSDRAQAFSRALFKNSYMLSITVAIATFSDGRFTKRTLARRLGISDNLVTSPLLRLEDADLIKKTGVGEEFERAGFEQVFWQPMVALYQEFVGGDLP